MFKRSLKKIAARLSPSNWFKKKPTEEPTHIDISKYYPRSSSESDNEPTHVDISKYFPRRNSEQSSSSSGESESESDSDSNSSSDGEFVPNPYGYVAACVLPGNKITRIKFKYDSAMKLPAHLIALFTEHGVPKEDIQNITHNITTPDEIEYLFGEFDLQFWTQKGITKNDDEKYLKNLAPGSYYIRLGNS